MTVKECYEKVGSDYDGVLKRLGSEALVKRFAVKFLNDPSFQDLTDGLAAKDGEKAFRAAHTLKGVCLNLGFTSNSGTGCAELKGNLQLFAVTPS